MEINENTYELFDKFLSGKISGEEKSSFEKMLASDNLFNEEFSFFRNTVAALESSGSDLLKKQLAEIASGISPSSFEKYSPSLKPKPFFKKFWWAIVITAATALVLWFVFHHRPEEQKNNFVPDSVMDALQFDSVNKKTPVLDSARNDEQCDSVFDPVRAKGGIKPKSSSAINRDICLFEMPVSLQPYFTTNQNEIRNWYIAASVYNSSSRKITVAFRPRDKAYDYYTYADHIEIFSSYTDSTNIRLYFPRIENNFDVTGATILLGDGKPGFFKLTKGDGERKLIRENNKGSSSTIKSYRDTAIFDTMRSHSR